MSKLTDRRRLLVVTAGLTEPSSTRLLADRLAEAVAERTGAAGVDLDVEVVELRELARPIADNFTTGFAAAELEDVKERVAAADALIAVTPVFSASYSGLFKSFFDVLDPEALTGKPVLIAATGGTPRHSLLLEHAMRPLFSYLHAITVPTAVYAAAEDWGAGGAAGELGRRIGRAAGELAGFLTGAGEGAALPQSAPAPVSAPGLGGNPLAVGLVPFEEQLAALRAAG
jgi:FMN reductase